ncbi:MAG: hypothetical protein IKY67_08550 [Paludibacteraceae bacterium]|nr:hypothetical protein [Paludibacteraceae bacterium]MBR5824175.1 hypothetical protein [Paludibacteraceae bacterium]
MYNVLWLDDEPEKMLLFEEMSKDDYSLKLEVYKTRKKGIDALKNNIEHWDAVLLDARMFYESEDEALSLKGLNEVIISLDRIALHKKIPYFIFTGQSSDSLEKIEFEDSFGTFYHKGAQSEWQRLWKDMLTAIKATKENQIKAKYQDVFDALASMRLPQETESILLDILLPLHYPDEYPGFTSVHHYTRLRKEVEYLFRAFHRVGLVPDQCVPGGNVNLNQCSIYLSGKPAEHARVQYGGEGDRVVPEYIESIIKSILEFGNINSHTVDLEKADEDRIAEIFSRGRSNYLIFGLTLQLCEAIVWSSKHIALHGDKEKNLSSCRILPSKEENKSSLPQEIIDKYEGKIFDPEYDGELKVWHCGECYVQITSWVSERKMKLKNLAINSKDWMSHKYPYYAKYDKC